MGKIGGKGGEMGKGDFTSISSSPTGEQDDLIPRRAPGVEVQASVRLFFFYNLSQ